MASIDFKNAEITIKDGTTPTPNEITIALGDGNLTYTENRPIIYDKDRGKLGTVRLGDEEPVEVSLSARWESITANTGDPPTVEDVLKQRGEASDWVTTSDDACEPYCVDIVFTYTPLCDDEPLEVITLPTFRHTSVNHDPKSAMLEISGSCNVTEATVERVAR
jgi:hypothetical protein